jgi:hypothetical protein
MHCDRDRGSTGAPLANLQRVFEGMAQSLRTMSALLPEADIRRGNRDFRFVPLSGNELLCDLPFECDAVGTLSGHGFHPLKAQLPLSIHLPQPVLPQGRTPDCCLLMSALPLKADIARRQLDVR